MHTPLACAEIIQVPTNKNDKTATPAGVTVYHWCGRRDLTSAAAEARSRGKRATGTFSNIAPVQVPIQANKKPPKRVVSLFGAGEGT